MTSAATTLERLRALQSTAAPGEGLLLVGGVDGRNHAGSREALNWLLNGQSGRDVHTTSTLGTELEEVMMVISADAARLYCPAALWPKLQPIVGRWRRLQVPPPACAATAPGCTQRMHLHAHACTPA